MSTVPSTPPAPLSRARILEAALRLLDERGAEGLTMRALAREVGSPPMSLYRHVASRDDLLDGVAALALGRIGPLPADGTWEDGLRAWAHGYRAMAHEHPGVPLLLAARPAAGYLARGDDAERMLRLLGRAGLPPADAELMLRAAIALVSGVCLLEARRGRLDAGDAGPAQAAEGRPLLAALLRHGGAGRDDALFALALDVIVEGIETRIAARA